MYVYYEIFPEDTSVGKKVGDVGYIPQVTEVVLSSNGSGNIVNWKNNKDKAMTDMLRSLFKQVPLAERTYDETSRIWTFIGFRGQVIIEGIKSMITQGLLNSVELKEIEDLEEKVKTDSLDRKKSHKVDEKKFNDEDFFYNKVTTTQPLAGAVLLEKLAPLLGVTTDYLTNESDNAKLKKLYRRAALDMHPDRNNGDGSRMSELNMLWNIFMQQV